MELSLFIESEYELLIGWIQSEKFNYQWGGPAYTFPLTFDQVSNHCANPDIFPFLFRVKGQVVGYVEFRRMTNEMCRICRVLILENHRGQGLAKKMLQLVIDEAQKKTCCSKVSLSVFEHNVTALSLYKSLGFEVVSIAERPEQVYGQLWTAVEMDKSIMNKIEFRNCDKNSPDLSALEQLFQCEWSDFRFVDSYKPDFNLPPVIVVMRDKKVIGGLAYTRYQEPHSDKDVIWINAVFVSQEWRGQGIASELINRAVNQVPENVQSRLYAYTNIASLYQSLGWSEVDIESEPNHSVMSITLKH